MIGKIIRVWKRGMKKKYRQKSKKEIIWIFLSTSYSSPILIQTEEER